MCVYDTSYGMNRAVHRFTLTTWFSCVSKGKLSVHVHCKLSVYMYMYLVNVHVHSGVVVVHVHSGVVVYFALFL